MFDLSPTDRWRYAFSAFGATLIGASLVYIPFSYGSVVADVPEVVVPVAVSIALILFGVRLRRMNYEAERIRRIVEWSWRGTLAAAVVGAWWVALHSSRGFPVAGLTDQILTLVSFGIGAGTVVGAFDARQQPVRVPVQRPTGRGDVVAETTWVSRGGVDAVTTAIIEAIADVEGIDPTRLDVTLYDHVDPDALELLVAHEGSPWQLLFTTDCYEIRVGSYGTVTLFDPKRADERPDSTEDASP